MNEDEYLGRFFSSMTELEKVLDKPEEVDLLMVALRWPDGPLCPSCGSSRLTHLRTGKDSGKARFRCGACTYQFSALNGTPFAGEKAPLADLVLASVLASGLRGLELAREIERRSDLTRAATWRLALVVQDAIDRWSGIPQRFDFQEARRRAEEAFRSKRTRGVLQRASVATVVVLCVALTYAAVTLAVERSGPLRTRWGHGDDVQMVVTPRHNGESRASWIARHAYWVELRKQRFPPD